MLASLPSGYNSLPNPHLLECGHVLMRRVQSARKTYRRLRRRVITLALRFWVLTEFLIINTYRVTEMAIG